MTLNEIIVCCITIRMGTTTCPDTAIGWQHNRLQCVKLVAKSNAFTETDSRSRIAENIISEIFHQHGSRINADENTLIF